MPTIHVINSQINNLGLMKREEVTFTVHTVMCLKMQTKNK